MGYIESDKSNPTYLVGSCCSKPDYSYPSQMRSRWKWIHIKVQKFSFKIHFTSNRKKGKI